MLDDKDSKNKNNQETSIDSDNRGDDVKFCVSIQCSKSIQNLIPFHFLQKVLTHPDSLMIYPNQYLYIYKLTDTELNMPSGT